MSEVSAFFLGVFEEPESKFSLGGNELSEDALTSDVSFLGVYEEAEDGLGVGLLRDSSLFEMLA